MKTKQRDEVGRGTKPTRGRSSRMRGMVAGVAAASALALGGALVAPPQEAKAATTVQDVFNAIKAVNSLNSNLSSLSNGLVNDVLAPALKLINSDACAPGYAGGKNGNADCSLTWGDGRGAAIVLTDPAELGKATSLVSQALKLLGVPNQAGLPANEGTARIIGDGNYLAVAMNGGKATAIALTPLSFANATADGGTSIAFAFVGLANAMNTPPIGISAVTGKDVRDLAGGGGILGDLIGGITDGIVLIPSIPLIPSIKRVDCFGVVTAAYNDKTGACLNVVGAVDAQAKWLDRNIPEFQLGLTNPLALLSDPASTISSALPRLFAGESLQNVLTQDFVRLTIGGDREGSYGLPNLVALTSAYGLKSPITISWLGQKVTVFPGFTNGDINGGVYDGLTKRDQPNYFGIPRFELGSFNANQILPSFTGLSLDNIAYPGSDILGLLGSLGGLLGGSSSVLNSLSGVMGPTAAVQTANLDTVTIQKVSTQSVVAGKLGGNAANTASLLNGFGADNKVAAKVAALSAPDTTGARSTTNFATRAGEAAKGFTGRAGDAAKSMTNNVRNAAENARTYTAPVVPKVPSPAYGTNSANTQDATPSPADSSQTGRTPFTAPKFPKFMGGQESDSSTPAQQGGAGQAPSQNAPAPGANFGGLGSGFKGGSKSFLGGSQQ